jgi:hypothetical protein
VSTDGGYGIGVVGPDYFNWHGQNDSAVESNATGTTDPGLNSALIRVRYPTSVAHELGHQFGLHTTDEEYDVFGVDATNGYWVERQEYISSRRAFMESPSAPENKLDRWIDNKDEEEFPVDYRDYDVMFEQLENSNSSTSTANVSASSSDDILYMKGLIYKDDSVDLSRWYSFEDGSLTSIEEGDYAAVVRDQDGTALLNRPFDVSFQLLASATEQIESPISTDVSGFSFPIRYPPEARSIQITKSGTTIAEVDPVAKLLRDAIDSIPEDDFRKKGPHDSQKKGYGDVAERRRKLLSDKVNTVARLLNQNDIHNAIHKLKDDLRPALKRWLKHHHGTTSPEQLTKEEIIQLVDRTINRLDQA